MTKIEHQTVGPLCFGRIKPKHRRRSLHLGNYLTRKYTPPPESRDWTPAATSSWKRMYNNDKVGCCVVAGGAHWEGVLTGNATGNPKQYTDDEIVFEYSEISGYVPGKDNTDVGCNMTDALDHWQHQGVLGGTKIAAWIRLDPKSNTEVRAAINEFGGAIAGLEMPKAWVNSESELRDGVIWNVAGDPDPNYGHCVLFAGYNPTYQATLTWGMNLWIADAARQLYCDELYAMISEDWLDNAKKLSPPGLDWTQLQADIQAYS